MLHGREEEGNSIVKTRGQFCRVKRLVEGQKYPFLNQPPAHFSAFFLPLVRSHLPSCCNSIRHAASFRSWTWCQLTFCCCVGDKSATTYLTIHSGLYVRAHFHWVSLWINITVKTCKQWENSKTGLQIGNSLTVWTRLWIYNSVIYVNSLLQLFLQHFLLLTCIAHPANRCMCVYLCCVSSGLQCFLLGLIQASASEDCRLMWPISSDYSCTVAVSLKHTCIQMHSGTKTNHSNGKKPADVVYASVCFAFYSISSSLSAHFLRLPV